MLDSMNVYQGYNPQDSIAILIKAKKQYNLLASQYAHQYLQAQTGNNQFTLKSQQYYDKKCKDIENSIASPNALVMWYRTNVTNDLSLWRGQHLHHLNSDQKIINDKTSPAVARSSAEEELRGMFDTPLCIIDDMISKQLHYLNSRANKQRAGNSLFQRLRSNIAKLVRRFV